jgi:hypothetical protein
MQIVSAAGRIASGNQDGVESHGIADLAARITGELTIIPRR